MEEEGAQQAALLAGGPAWGSLVHLPQHSVRLVERLELVLGVVGLRHVLPQLDATGRGHLMAIDELHEGRLAGAVGAHQRHVVASVQREAHALVHEVVAIGLCHVVDLHDHIARARRLREAEVHLLRGLRQHDELFFDLLELLHALLDLAGLGGFVAEALDEGLDVGDVALLGGALRTQLLEVVLALLQIARVVTGIGHEALVLERRDVAHASVHERAVVADQQHGPVVGGQEGLEPLDALKVEVVGGLVEQQEVGMAQQQLRERDAHLPAARELLGRLVEVLDGKAEAAEDLTGACLKLVAAKALEAVLRGAVALEQAVEVNVVSGIGNLVLHLGDALLELADLGGGIDHLGQGRLLARELGLLLQVSNGRVAGEAYRARVGALLPHENLEQRRLASAVGTHEAPPLAGIELQGCGRVENTAAEGLFDLVCEGNQRRSLAHCMVS